MARELDLLHHLLVLVTLTLENDPMMQLNADSVSFVWSHVPNSGIPTFQVPKGGHEITLTQTSEECRKNLSSLENGIYDEDESNLFHFNPPAAHIDVMWVNLMMILKY